MKEVSDARTIPLSGPLARPRIWIDPAGGAKLAGGQVEARAAGEEMWFRHIRDRLPTFDPPRPFAFPVRQIPRVSIGREEDSRGWMIGRHLVHLAPEREKHCRPIEVPRDPIWNIGPDQRGPGLRLEVSR